MAKSQATSQAARVRSRPTTRTKPGPGRPPVHQETWSKVSVVLFDRQIHHLDRMATGVKGANGKTMNRAEIIRALIDGMLESGLDLKGAPSEAALRAKVARRLAAQRS
jgi:hypothetical protein